MPKIIFNITSRVIRGPYTHDEQPFSFEGQRTITTAEENQINTLRNGGAAAVVDDLVSGLRAATADEADERKTFKAVILAKIKAMPNLPNRATAYQAAPAILLAIENGDKDGAKAVVDTMTVFGQAARDRIKALIDLIS